MTVSASGIADKTASTDPFENHGKYRTLNKIDRLVLAQLKKHDIKPANISSDAIFLRRIFLDVIGRLPTQQEVTRFLTSEDRNKRSKAINSILTRKEFADYQALKWGDILRIKAEFPINLWPNGVQAYHQWVHDAIQHNMPYDQFVRELLTTSGSNFRAPQVNFYRAIQEKTPNSIANAVALTFMGVRLDKFSKAQQEDFETFFSRVGFKKTEEWKEEIIYLKPDATNDFYAIFPDGTKVTIPQSTDPRLIFAEWLTAPDNPYFARNIVNRIWAWLLGRGIINPVDDICSDNPASNPELLAFLENELVKSKNNLRHIYRLILNSRTYQQSSIPRSNKREAEALFAYYPVRQLDAEVLIDAICDITGTHENYVSLIPEPYTFVPITSRSINLADGSISSQFLEMFGRPSRDTGFAAERNNKPTPAQRLHMLNSTHIQNKLAKSWRMKQLIKRSIGDRDKKVETIYLEILSRYPTSKELDVVKKYLRIRRPPKQAIIDIIWALINSKEFLFKH